MRNLQVYTVYDSKAEAYLTPFFAPTDAVAERIFASAAQDENHEFYKFAADYTLFLIGGYDPLTGQLAPTASIKNLGNAINFQRNPDWDKVTPADLTKEHEPLVVVEDPTAMPKEASTS